MRQAGFEPTLSRLKVVCQASRRLAQNIPTVQFQSRASVQGCNNMFQSILRVFPRSVRCLSSVSLSKNSFIFLLTFNSCLSVYILEYSAHYLERSGRHPSFILDTLKSKRRVLTNAAGRVYDLFTLILN